MIAVDTSTLVAFLDGQSGADIERLEEALLLSDVVVPPVVLTEVLSAPNAGRVGTLVEALPLLAMADGYWARAGLMRSRVLRRGLRARLADTLIAQACIDSGVALLTRDGDFRHFARYGGLELVLV